MKNSGTRGRGERQAGDQLVDRAIAVAHREQAEDDRQRDRRRPPPRRPGTACSTAARLIDVAMSSCWSAPCRDRRAGCPTASGSSGHRPGRSRPISSRRLASATGVADWPRMDCATSPGRICVPTKISTETASSRRMPSAMRWAMSFRMGDDMAARPDQAVEPALGQRVAAHHFLSCRLRPSRRPWGRSHR